VAPDESVDPEIGTVTPDESVEDGDEDDVTVDVAVVGSVEDVENVLDVVVDDGDEEYDVTVDVTVVGSSEDVENVLDVVVDDDVLVTDVLLEDDPSAESAAAEGPPDATGGADGFCSDPDLAEVSAERCRSVCWISA
jgi:SepF-like predicted cell division protein (DUF552 family)